MISDVDNFDYVTYINDIDAVVNNFPINDVANFNDFYADLILLLWHISLFPIL